MSEKLQTNVKKYAKQFTELVRTISEQNERIKLLQEQSAEFINKCYKSDSPFFQCCCECIHHSPTHIHCTTIVNRKSQTCVCGIQTGWACVDTDSESGLGRVYTNWPEHSVGCEMHEKRGEK